MQIEEDILHKIFQTLQQKNKTKHKGEWFEQYLVS
jgi:hypothetical protein